MSSIFLYKTHHYSSIDLTCHKSDGLFGPFDVILSAVQHLDKIEQNKHWHTLIEMRRTNWTSHPEHSWTSNPNPHLCKFTFRCINTSVFHSSIQQGPTLVPHSTSQLRRFGELPGCHFAKAQPRDQIKLDLFSELEFTDSKHKIHGILMHCFVRSNGEFDLGNMKTKKYYQ